MGQDWVEFENEHDCKVALRPTYIEAFAEIDDGSKNKNMVELHIGIDNGADHNIVYAKGTYEQVKQKIMSAERIDLSDVVVEHFTKDEYEFIKAVLPMCLSEVHYNIIGPKDKGLFESIRNKLNEILKEEE